MDLTFLKTGGIKIACIDVENGFFTRPRQCAWICEFNLDARERKIERREERNLSVGGPRAFRHLPRYACRPTKACKHIKWCATGRFQGGVNNDKITLCDILLLGFNGIETDDPRLVSDQQLVSGRGDKPIDFYASKALKKGGILVRYFFH